MKMNLFVAAAACVVLMICGASVALAQPAGGPPAPAPAPVVAPAPVPAPVPLVPPAPPAPPADPALPPRRRPTMFAGKVTSKGEVDEDGNFIRSRTAEIDLQGEVDEETRQLIGLDKPKQKGWVPWVVCVVIALLAIAAIVFLILFLVKGDGKKDATPAPVAPVSASTSVVPAPALAPAQALVAPAPVVDPTARATANTVIGVANSASKKAEEAQATANDALGLAGGTAKLHQSEPFADCVARTMAARMASGSKTRELLDCGLLTEDQVRANSEFACQ